MASKVWAAAELEQLSPAERHELFEASILSDLEQAPAALVARARSRVEGLIAETDTSQPVERRTTRRSRHAGFFEDLDRHLGVERGADGEPSTNDFQVFELLEIVDRFATGLFELPEFVVGRGDYRILIASGALVHAFAVVGQLASDGAVELISLEVDLGSD